MRETRKGKIDISELNSPPEKHEYETAKYFANRGYNVRFIRPSSIKGMHSADFEMAGRVWETKCPIRYGNSSFDDNFKKAIKQSNHIIYDLRRLDVSDEEHYLNRLKKKEKSRKVEILLVITRDGRLLIFKGFFDII